MTDKVSSVRPGIVIAERVGDHILRVTLNRPEKRNAVNGAVASALEAIVKSAEADMGVRVVVLTSSDAIWVTSGESIEPTVILL